MKWLKDWWDRQCFHDWVVIDSDVTTVFGQIRTSTNAICMKCGKKENELERARVIEAKEEAERKKRIQEAKELWEKTKCQQS